MTGRINEVESYAGENDLASHASQGKTKRNAMMFGEAGRTYVYLIYGMYHCLNIVTEKKGFPAAVLIRGAVRTKLIAPPAGRRGRNDALWDGPGKLCRAMHITRTQNGLDLTRSEKLFMIDDGYVVSLRDIRQTPRIGVAYAGNDADLPWRYLI